jgi:hypothetical protein
MYEYFHLYSLKDKKREVMRTPWHMSPQFDTEEDHFLCPLHVRLQSRISRVLLPEYPARTC